MATHALVTGPISGRIPTPHDEVPDDYVDVTPDVLYFEGDDTENPPPALLAVADAIEEEHWVRDTHPVQVQCRELHDQPDITEEALEQHSKLHTEIKTKVEKRLKAHKKGGRS